MRPSALLTPLLRGHVTLRARLPLAGIPWSPSPSCLFSSPSCREHSSLASQGAAGEDQRYCRKWSIPWGAAPGGEPLNLVRELRILPGVEERAEESRTFRVMSFNMLAQSLACSEYFPYVAKGELKQKKRMPRVTEEISRYGADIICLQECDAFGTILEFLRGEAAPEGTRFDGVYKAGEGKEHGVAVFFDSKVFRMLDSGSYDFGPSLNKGAGLFVLLEDVRCRSQGTGPEGNNELDETGTAPKSRSHGSRHGDIDEHRSSREGDWARKDARDEDVAEGPGSAKFRARRTLCVATTHLYWHPKGDGIRLAQAEALMESMEAFLHSRFGDEASSVPVVLAGDLNTVPGVGVYRLLAEGSCAGETPEVARRRIGTKKSTEDAVGAESGSVGRAEDIRDFRQGFEGLRSAYGSYRSLFGSQLEAQSLRREVSVGPADGRSRVGHVQLGARVFTDAPPTNAFETRALADGGDPGRDRVETIASGEPEFTSCTSFFAASIDYIWFTPHLEVRSLLKLPSLEEAMKDGGLPSACYPSDHLSIMAELQWPKETQDDD